MIYKIGGSFKLQLINILPFSRGDTRGVIIETATIWIKQNLNGVLKEVTAFVQSLEKDI